MVHEYEIVFIVRPDVDDADVNACIERIEGTVAEGGSHLLERDDWGKRKLAYPIQKHTKGHYTLLRVISDPSAVLEIERKMRLDDRIIRFLTVKVDECVDVELRIQQAAEKAVADAEERKRRAIEEEARRSLSDDDDDDDYDMSLD